MSVFQRVPDNHPSRCQAVGKNGQCPFKAVGDRENGEAPWVGPSVCPRHNAHMQTKSVEKASTSLYMASLWKERIGEQANHPKVKSLREEMGVLRMMLNERLGTLNDSVALLMHSGQVIEITREIGKLAKTAHAIEKDMGQLLDKTQAESWIQDLLKIIGQYINDPDVLIALSEDIVDSLEKFTTTPD